ncbi:MAG: hypothetical protein ACAI43_26590 [Phycisphaerae bacterium]|nr:hypothetical protein [Tepidisphaeraceae bacterium]
MNDEVEQIRALRLAHPFRAFVVTLCDGRVLPVIKPYHVAIAVDGSHMMFGDDGPDNTHLWPRDVVGARIRPLD